MNKFKSAFAYLVEWIDVHILDHRVYAVCKWLGKITPPPTIQILANMSKNIVDCTRGQVNQTHTPLRSD